jgi:hypothetical protein
MFDFDFEPEEKPGLWKVQDEPFTILKNRLGRVYAAPPEERLKAFYYTSPTKYEALDQVCASHFYFQPKIKWL